MKIALSVGIGVMLREDLAGADEERSRPQTRRPWTELQIQGFLARLREQDQLNEWEATGEQITNLRYAIEAIQPACHEEMSFAIWAYLHTYPVSIFTDEYKHRRDGQKCCLPAHPVLTLKKWGRPKTYGMLLYKEQMQALFGELSGGKIISDKEYRGLQISWHKCRFQEEQFLSLLSESYQKSLTPGEKKRIYEAICFFWPGIQLYVYCSSMSDQAWQAAQKG